MSHTVKLNGSHWKTIKAIWRQTAHPFVLITRSPGLSSFRRARHWDVFGIIFLMLQQPVQQKNTTDYSQRVSWLSSIYCDTLLYFSPPFLPLLFLPSPPPPPPPLPFLPLPPPPPLLLPFLSSHLLPPSLHPPLSPPLFRCFSCALLEWKWMKNWSNFIRALRRFAYKDCVALCVYVAARVGLTVHCMCASCLCVPLCVQQEIQKLGHIDHPGVWKLRGYQSNMV